MKIYCVTNTELKYLEQLKLDLAGVGNKKFKKGYISSLVGKNIQSKEKLFRIDISLLVLEKQIEKIR